MKISVLIDSNAWNFLFGRNMNLSYELPTEEFALFITPEVEIEIVAIPDIGVDGSDKTLLKQYIRESLAKNQITTTESFGFAEANPSDGPSTYGGFGQGTFQSDTERDWYAREEVKSSFIGKSKKRSGLAANEADAAVSAASFNSIVLTCDKNKGPIKRAKKVGGKIVHLSDELLAAQSLQQILRSFGR